MARSVRIKCPGAILPGDGPRKPANVSQILRRARLDKGPARTKRKWKGVRVRILRLIPISPPANRAREDRFPRPIACAFTSYGEGALPLRLVSHNLKNWSSVAARFQSPVGRTRTTRVIVGSNSNFWTNPARECPHCHDEEPTNKEDYCLRSASIVLPPAWARMELGQARKP